MMSNLTLGQLGLSQERARKASKIRDERYLASPKAGFKSLYQALHNGEWRDFTRASIETLGLDESSTYEQVKERILEVGELCPVQVLRLIAMRFKEQGDVCMIVTGDKLFRATYHDITELPLQMPTPAFYLQTDIAFMLKKRKK
jgi:hypothetical protein|tara:strand:+ start:563244 stop:563675 length:432 start_codon:yes stop_codon:yes gene_type:complete